MTFHYDVDLPNFPSISVNFCFIYFEAMLLMVYKFRTIISSQVVDTLLYLSVSHSSNSLSLRG